MTDQTKDARFTELAQHVNLLDKTDATVFSASAIAAPTAAIHNFAEAIEADAARVSQAATEQAVEAKETLTGAVEIEKRLHHIVKLANEQGLAVLIVPQPDPTKLPTISVLPFHNPSAPAAETSLA